MNEQPKKRGGKGQLRGGDGKNFSKDYQPDKNSQDKKKKTWENKRLLKHLLQSSTKTSIGEKKVDYRKIAADFFNIPQKYVTVEVMMNFRLIEKIIARGDHNCYNSLMDRAYGKAAQPLTGADGKDLIPVPRPMMKLDDGTLVPI